MPASGPGFYLKSPDRAWARAETAKAFAWIAATWQSRHPHGPRLGVTDVSLRGGGPMDQHKSHQHGTDVDIRPLKRNLVWRALDRASGELLDLLSLQYVFYPSSFGVLADEWFRSSDVVQLHNLHGSYFGFTALPALTSRRPVVWQLHDHTALRVAWKTVEVDGLYQAEARLQARFREHYGVSPFANLQQESED